jgi:hypothetical protein
VDQSVPAVPATIHRDHIFQLVIGNEQFVVDFHLLDAITAAGGV